MSKTGRNDPCPCGSGKKYKKCCREKDAEAEVELVKNNHKETEDEADPFLLPHGLKEEVIGEEDEVEEEKEEYKEYEEERNGITDKAYPVISYEEQQMVDAWWEDYEEMKDPDPIKEHLLDFMKAHPHLVENLELESEVLFELGGDFLQEERFDEFIEVLLQVRNNFPSMYIRSAGYYDFDIIAWLIANRRAEEIERYLNNFKEHPAVFVEQLFDTINLLMATNTTNLLTELIKATAGTVITSPSVINGEDIVEPLVIQLLSEHLQPPLSDTGILRFSEALKENIPDEVVMDTSLDFWQPKFEMILKPFAPWPKKMPGRNKEQKELCLSMTLNYMRYLHQSTGISLVSAHYYSTLIREYFYEYIELTKGRVKPLFDFSEKMLDKIILKRAQKFFFLDAAKAFSIMNAVYYFAAYLQECGNMNEKEKSAAQAACAKLYREHHPHLKKEYAAVLCFSAFPLWKVI